MTNWGMENGAMSGPEAEIIGVNRHIILLAALAHTCCNHDCKSGYVVSYGELRQRYEVDATRSEQLCE